MLDFLGSVTTPAVAGPGGLRSHALFFVFLGLRAPISQQASGSVAAILPCHRSTSCYSDYPPPTLDSYAVCSPQPLLSSSPQERQHFAPSSAVPAAVRTEDPIRDRDRALKPLSAIASTTNHLIPPPSDRPTDDRRQTSQVGEQETLSAASGSSCPPFFSAILWGAAAPRARMEMAGGFFGVWGRWYCPAARGKFRTMRSIHARTSACWRLGDLWGLGEPGEGCDGEVSEASS